MSEQTETFSLSIEGAEAYEARFVPRLFREWADHVVGAADVSGGDEVLDVACGTGVVARTAAERVEPGGRVVGVDLNEAMLTVARRVAPELEWRHADAADLPFDDGSFDAVLCQMALMFFPDRRAALAEMARVVRDQGIVAVVVPAALSMQPAYGPFVDVAVRHAGPEAASLLGTYWSCGDAAELAAAVESAGLSVVACRTRTGTALFDSPDDLVATEVEGSPLVHRIDDETYERIRADVREALAPFVTAGGTFEAPLVGHVLTARRRTP
ncbi:MAG TPA: methyltransferase domain-containing protein [Acidimicrobiia bacterium]|nr:methyltransferase domain-containing protein [Acidimicrobiia bacterium]